MKIFFLVFGRVPALLLILGQFWPAAPATEVSNFALLDQRGRLHELRRMNGRAVVLFFTANGCPVARQSASKLNALRAIVRPMERAEYEPMQAAALARINQRDPDDWPVLACALAAG